MTRKAMKTIFQQCVGFPPNASGVVCERRMFWLENDMDTKLVMWDMEKGMYCEIHLAEAGVLSSSKSYSYVPKLFSLEDGNKLGLLWNGNYAYLMAQDVDGDKLEELTYVSCCISGSVEDIKELMIA